MVANRVLELRAIAVDSVAAGADNAADPGVLRLENLDTDIRPAAAALAATRAAIDDDDANSYLPFPGWLALRSAVTARARRLTGVHYDPERSCVITAGGLNGVLNTLLATINPGDTVLLTDPTYIGLINRVRLAGGVPRFVALRPSQHGWQLDRDQLLASIDLRPKLLLLLSPGMPTGCVFDTEDWETVARVVDATGAWLLYDAAMERILFDKPYIHPASVPALTARTISVGSLSKEQRMIGWRVGWVLGPPEIMADVALVSISNVVCQVGIAQSAAIAALAEPERDFQRVVATWQDRHTVLVQELEGFEVIPAAGGWSLLLDATPLGRSAAELSSLLFQRAKIAATPMTGWGSESSRRYLRFVFANESRERLLGIGERIRRALAAK
jgi:aspartate/methionine/tyrosine aminotransferase